MTTINNSNNTTFHHQYPGLTWEIICAIIKERFADHVTPSEALGCMEDICAVWGKDGMQDIQRSIFRVTQVLAEAELDPDMESIDSINEHLRYLYDWLSLAQKAVKD
ncbi:MAG: hypothetical protein EOO43_14870 [Flavobacterium sp.]|nr:MAG: hypothetical protein EOO43_14870 [Flavobacterium sp.]